MQQLEPLQIVDGAYLDDTRPYDSQDCVNYLPEAAENANARSPAVLRGAPGLVLFATIGAGPIRGMRNVEGQLFVVSGTQLYRVSTSGVGTALGVIPGEQRVSMSHNQVAGGNQLIVVNGGSGFVWDTSNSTFQQVSDTDYPGARVVDYIDGYLAQLPPDRKQWFHSDLNTALSYLGLDFYQAEALPDDIVSLLRVYSDLWIFGQQTIQPFVNTGATEGTFAPAAGTFIEQGCGGTFTPAIFDNSVAWLGNDGIVYRANGYSPQRISTFAIEQAIAGLNWANAFAMSYEDRGHKIYYLTFPDGQTWGYDAATQRWHRRQSYGLNRWRVNALVFWQGQWIGGDFESGRLYTLDWKHYAEHDRPLIASRKTAYLHANQNRMFLSALELLMNTGAGGALPQSQSTPDIIVAVATAGSNGSRVLRSTDGEEWTLESTPADLAWAGICFSEDLNLFVAVATDNTPQCVMTSPDGITWTLRTAFSAHGWQAVAWSQSLGLFAAVGATDSVMTSPDGISWTLRTGVLAGWRSVAWSDDLEMFIAGSPSGARIMTSPDGITWTQRTNTDAVYAIAPGLPRVVAANRSNNSNSYSDNGTTWTVVPDNGTGQGFGDIAFGAGLYVMVNIFGAIYSSPDGVVWTSRANPGLVWEGVHFSASLGLFIVTAAANSTGSGNRVATSPDGITWTGQSTPAAADTGGWFAVTSGVEAIESPATDHYVSLRYSDDGGRNWSNWKTKSLGAVGEYGKRVRFKRLGEFRNRVFEIQVSSPVQRDLLTASLQARAA